MTKNTEIIKKSSTDLAKGVVENREELRKIRFATAGAGKDVMKARNLRKEIARSLTELTKRKQQDVTAEAK